MEALKSGMLFQLLIPGSKGGPDAVVLIALDAGADKFQTHDAVLNGGIGVGRGKGSGFFGSQMLAEGAVEVAERLEVPLRMSRRQTAEAVGFDAVAFAVGRQNLSGFVQTGEFQKPRRAVVPLNSALGSVSLNRDVQMVPVTPPGYSSRMVVFVSSGRSLGYVSNFASTRLGTNPVAA